MSLLTSSLSRAARRIVLQFMLVASVPLGVLGWLAYEALTAQARAHNQRQLDLDVGNDAMRVFDRLLAARVALELRAQAATGADGPQTPTGVFRTVVVVDPTSSSPLVRWWFSQPQPDPQRLHWSPVTADHASRVVVSAIEPGTERTWLGEIDPDWLWFDTFGASDSHRGWVVDGAGRLLHTSGQARHESAPGPGNDLAMRGTEKHLFLGHEFGTADWVFHERRPDTDASVQGVAFGGLGLKVVAAALLLVATLSLVQIRRTMDPLQRLVAVTRRLAQQDYGARVALSGDDEFRELGESFNDMAQRMGAQAEALTHQATHDSLTGLRNRAGLHRALDDALATGRPFAVIFIDLDRFKGVNDSLGHHAGDAILRQAAIRLQAVLPERAVVARPGGDEFVVLLDDEFEGAADAAAQGICGPLAAVFEVEGREIALGASVGWARFPDDGRTVTELMRHADMAMYSAKDHGRGQARRFTQALDAAAAQQAWVVNDLRLAVERGQFLLHYQPRVDAELGVADTAEALVRWQHPQRGLVPPALFIEIAEETGMIRELGGWVLREACRQLAQWRREGVAIEHVSVNLSALQLAHDSVVDEVVAAIEDHGLQPSNLELEVTESLFIGESNAAAARLARLRKLGIAIALDDFGTGYSSMAYLSRMPVDVIKIDRAFVKQLGEDRSADTVTRAIVTLAHSLDLRLVAEGVETQAQADALKAMGCQQLQGYLFAKPVAAADYPRLDCIAASTAIAEV